MAVFKSKARTIKAVILAIALFVSVFTTTALGADANTSRYSQLSSDMVITGVQNVLSVTVTFSQSTKVYLQSDGRIYPSGGGALANVTLTVDGNVVGSHAVTDWSNSTNRQQRSYNTIGGVTVTAGTHTFALRAETLNSVSYTVGSGSNLCVMTNPAANMAVADLTADSQLFNFTTINCNEGVPVPHTSLLSCTVNNTSGPIIALGSARAYGGGGDAMFGIYKDGSSLPNNEGAWTVNDVYTGAETQNPFFTHAFINATGQHTISLDASEFPWIGREDTVQYRTGAGSKLVCLYGGMTVAGSAPLSYNYDRRIEYINIGTGNDYQLVQTTITIPQGHNGVVLFMTKNRIQCDAADTGGTVRLWINIDGVSVGSTGIQQLTYPNCESQRSMSASYLACGANALSPGTHTVTVYARADGTFRWPSLIKDLPLIWFD